MQNYVDDSELAKILTEANQVMSGISGKKQMDSKEMMELARRVAANTSSYTGTDAKPATHFIEKSARNVKSRISSHINVLKSTASSISQIKERIQTRQGRQSSISPDVLPQASPEADQLSEYNRKIDDTLKYLSTRTSGKTQIEQKIKKYREIMGDVDGTLRELPKSIKEGKVKKGKPLDQKLIQKVDTKTDELAKKMQALSFAEKGKYSWADGYSSDEDDEGVGDWINYEGFNNQEDLDRYNEIFKEFVGEYPNEYEKRNQEEGYYDKDGLGRAIDTNKPGRQRRRGLFSPPNKNKIKEEEMKKYLEMEKNLRDVLAESMNAKGDTGIGSLVSEKRFLEKYIDKKMDTIHTVDELPQIEGTDKKKKSLRKAGIKKKIGDGGELYLDGKGKKGTLDAEQKTADSSLKSTRKTVMAPIGFDFAGEKKKSDSSKSITSDEYKELDEHSISWDMERIKKLIVKERQEHLRKKREAWERNNELSEEMIDREKLLALKKGLHKQAGPFDAPVPSSKISPSDFITDRERHDKIYRKAVKGRDGVYNKEELDYEFGVNPFYYEPIKNKKEAGDAKEVPISIKGYRGVRRKPEI